MEPERQKPERRLRGHVPAPEIPGYAIEGPIGRGSTGVVYRARQLAVDREVALKILHPQLAQRPRVVQRLQREARTTARLAHPNIVSAIDMGEIDGVWWYAMEFVDGPTLATRLKQEGRLTERQALRFFIPLCEALEHAWEHGVVHRDIKPANVLIDRGRGARLADLGLAFADDDPSLTGSGGTLGTPHYMSPEQARSPADADVRSDIWSFGATLFHAVCGRAPFSGDSVAEVLSGVLYARVPDPHLFEPRLSKGLVLVLRKCLSRDPLARYQTPRELLLDLERVRERRLPRVRRAALDPVDRGPRTGLKWTLAAAGVLVVAATAAGLVGWVSDRDASAGDAVAGSAPSYAPIEALARRMDAQPERLSDHLTALDDMEASLPPALVGRWSELGLELRSRLRSTLDELLRDVGDRMDARARAYDFRGALAALATEFPAELVARSGYTLETLPEERQRAVRARLAVLRERVDANARDAGRSLERLLDRHLAAVLIPEVDHLQAQQRWRSADALLNVDDGELLRRADFEAARFPADLLEEYLESARGALFKRAVHLEAAWNSVDRELRRWVERRADTLERRLEADTGAPDAAGELRRAFEAELAERGLVPAELHPDGLSVARAELDRRARALALREDHLREQRTLEDFQRLQEICGRLWSLREYDAIRDYFETFSETVAELPGDVDALWRVRLENRLVLLAHEAELLEGGLERAAERIVELDGQTHSLRAGSVTLIRRPGKVRVHGDPLNVAFSFDVGTGEPERVVLRSLAGAEIERLAGLREGDSEPSNADDRLLLALFRLREGDLQSANRILSSGPLPRTGLDGRLVADARERVVAALERREVERQGRVQRVRSLLELVDRPQHGAVKLDFIEQLLGEYQDLLTRDDRDRLRRMREELRGARAPQLADFRRAFALPQESSGLPPVELTGRGRVRLRFDFTTDQTGSWEPGGWLEGVGWTAQRDAGRLADLGRGGPRLALRDPLAPARGDVEVLLRIEQPYESGPPKCMVVSVAGYCFALVGQLSAGEPRWLVDSDGLESILTRIQAGEGQRDARLLQRGKTHELTFVVRQTPASVEFRLDGRQLHRGLLTAPNPASPNVSLRSWEPIRLLSAEVEAEY